MVTDSQKIHSIGQRQYRLAKNVISFDTTNFKDTILPEAFAFVKTGMWIYFNSEGQIFKCKYFDPAKIEEEEQ